MRSYSYLLRGSVVAVMLIRVIAMMLNVLVLLISSTRPVNDVEMLRIIIGIRLGP